jgi:hypothetical protein
MGVGLRRTLRTVLAGSLVFGSVLTGAVIGGATPASAATVTVTNCNDSGTGSLRQAIADAAPGDTVTFALAPVCSTISLASTLTITNSIDIMGPGAAILSVDGGGSVRDFLVSSGSSPTISGITIKGGSGSFGGGIYNNYGDLTLDDTAITGDSATDYGGGGVANYGTLAVANSTFTNDSGGGYGGGAILNGGGCSSPCATLTVTGSTFSGNYSGSGGAGITNYWSASIESSTFWNNSSAQFGGALNNDGTEEMSSSTVVGSSAYGGGGIDNNASFVVQTSIFADSTAGNDCLGQITDGGYNIDDDGSCQFNAANHSISDSNNIDASLAGGLASNGGPTPTILPTANSPAAGAIPTGTTLNTVPICPRLDQRGAASQGNCAIGAVEPFVPSFFFSTTPLPPAAPGTAYGPVTLTTDGGTPSATFKWKKVTAPRGLKLSSAGVLSGTPSKKLSAGPTSITVTATETVITVSGKKKTTTKTPIQATIPLTIT